MYDSTANENKPVIGPGQMLDAYWSSEYDTLQAFLHSEKTVIFVLIV